MIQRKQTVFLVLAAVALAVAFAAMLGVNQAWAGAQPGMTTMDDLSGWL